MINTRGMRLKDIFTGIASGDALVVNSASIQEKMFSFPTYSYICVKFSLFEYHYAISFILIFRLWKSLTAVKKMHNSASTSGCKANVGRISQMDMALTQFGFIGFSVVRGEYLGINNPNENDIKAFIHVWRVIGYLFGIEDR